MLPKTASRNFGNFGKVTELRNGTEAWSGFTEAGDAMKRMEGQQVGWAEGLSLKETGTRKAEGETQNIASLQGNYTEMGDFDGGGAGK